MIRRAFLFFFILSECVATGSEPGTVHQVNPIPASNVRIESTLASTQTTPSAFLSRYFHVSAEEAQLILEKLKQLDSQPDPLRAYVASLLGALGPEQLSDLDKALFEKLSSAGTDFEIFKTLAQGLSSWVKAAHPDAKLEIYSLVTNSAEELEAYRAARKTWEESRNTFWAAVSYRVKLYEQKDSSGNSKFVLVPQKASSEQNQVFNQIVGKIPKTELARFVESLRHALSPKLKAFAAQLCLALAPPNSFGDYLLVVNKKGGASEGLLLAFDSPTQVSVESITELLSQYASQTTSGVSPLLQSSIAEESVPAQKILALNSAHTLTALTPDTYANYRQAMAQQKAANPATQPLQQGPDPRKEDAPKPKFLKIDRQQTDVTCWAASARHVLKLFGIRTSENEVCRQRPGRIKIAPASPHDITSILSKYKVAARYFAQRLSIPQLKSIFENHQRIIAFVPSHFIVLQGISPSNPNKIVASDPGDGHTYTVTPNELLRKWGGWMGSIICNPPKTAEAYN